MRLVQCLDAMGERRVGRIDAVSSALKAILGAGTVYDLAREAIASGRTLAALVASRPAGAAVDCDALERDGRILPPIDHPDPAHRLVTGTGLTHLGGAAAEKVEVRAL